MKEYTPKRFPRIPEEKDNFDRMHNMYIDGLERESIMAMWKMKQNRAKQNSDYKQQGIR